MLEDQIEQDAVEWAEANGWVCRKIKWQGRRHAPDQGFFGHQRFVLIEFKAPGKEPVGAQKKELERLQAHYPEVYWVDNLAAAIRILKYRPVV